MAKEKKLKLPRMRQRVADECWFMFHVLLPTQSRASVNNNRFEGVMMAFLCSTDKKFAEVLEPQETQ